jgi:hypothetical protein
MNTIQDFIDKYNITERDLYILSKLEADKSTAKFLNKVAIESKKANLIKKYKINFHEKKKFFNSLQNFPIHNNETLKEKYYNAENDNELVKAEKKAKLILIISFMTIIFIIFTISINKNSSNSNTSTPKLGEYASFGHKTDIYCGSSNYIKLKENNKLEFYSKINGEGIPLCRAEGTFILGDDNSLIIQGLNNPNAMELDKQFNGKYIWAKDKFDIPCFKKADNNIILTNYDKNR